MSVETLARYGINVARYPKLQQEEGCADLKQIDDASARLDVSAQRLLLSVPQAALSNVARDAVPPTRWDNGINALMLNYRFSGAQSRALEAHRSGSDSQFLSLRPGVNVGPWRLRNYSTGRAAGTAQQAGITFTPAATGDCAAACAADAW